MFQIDETAQGIETVARVARDPLFGFTKPTKVYDSAPQSKSQSQNLRSANLRHD